MLDNPITRIAIALILGALVTFFILAILPIYPLPAQFASALTYFFGVLWQFDFVFPVSTMLSLFSLLIVLEILFASIHFYIFLKNLFTKRS